MSHEFHTNDPFINFLNRFIQIGVKILAALMVLVILWGVADVVYVMVKQAIEPPFGLLKIGDILKVFEAFLAVLIAIEIFLNITLYLRDDVIHVNLVIATALMAVARKVIVFDFEKIAPAYIYATGFVILSLGITYWLLLQTNKKLKDDHAVASPATHARKADSVQREPE